MKRAELSYHRQFPQTPVSWWVGARATSPEPHDFETQRKLWCLLTIHFHDIELCFAFPEELDHVLDVFSRDPMPSVRALASEHELPWLNKNWLSRLPAKIKSRKARNQLESFIEKAKEVHQFRAFYEDEPVRTFLSE